MDGVQCKKCRYLLKDKDGYNWCPNKIDDPDIDLIRDCKWYAVKTNADCIRSMTDEALAETFDLLTMTMPDMKDDKRNWLDWLRKEANDEEIHP